MLTLGMVECCRWRWIMGQPTKTIGLPQSKPHQFAQSAVLLLNAANEGE
jgi:hypothetical protein